MAIDNTTVRLNRLPIERYAPRLKLESIWSGFRFVTLSPPQLRGGWDMRKDPPSDRRIGESPPPPEEVDE